MNQIYICSVIHVRSTTFLLFYCVKKFIHIIVEFLLIFVNKLKLGTFVFINTDHYMVDKIKSFGLH